MEKLQQIGTLLFLLFPAGVCGIPPDPPAAFIPESGFSFLFYIGPEHYPYIEF